MPIQSLAVQIWVFCAPMGRRGQRLLVNFLRPAKQAQVLEGLLEGPQMMIGRWNACANWESGRKARGAEVRAALAGGGGPGLRWGSVGPDEAVPGMRPVILPVAAVPWACGLRRGRGRRRQCWRARAPRS